VHTQADAPAPMRPRLAPGREGVSIEVVDNPELSRYEVRVDEELAGFAQYRVRGDLITIFHAEVEPAHEGKGVGSQLAKSALADVRERGLELVPRCPFISSYVRRHPDLYLDLVAEPLREQVMASGTGEAPAGDG
jgi:uncharacterized protein